MRNDEDSKEVLPPVTEDAGLPTPPSPGRLPPPDLALPPETEPKPVSDNGEA